MFERYTGDAKYARKRLSMIKPDAKIFEAQAHEHVSRSRADFRFNQHRCRPENVDVALIKLPKASPRWTISTPHWLNLITLEELRKFISIFSHNTRQRYRQVVAEREIGFTASLVYATLQYFEDQLIPFFAILPHQRFNIFSSRRFERLEAVSLEHVFNYTNDVFAPANVFG